jgi:hypothetical protein
VIAHNFLEIHALPALTERRYRTFAEVSFRVDDDLGTLTQGSSYVAILGWMIELR